MALGATFWSTSGLSALWHDITGLATGTISTPGAAQTAIWLAPVKIYQEPMVLGLNTKKQHDNPGFDSGFFYLVETTLGGTTWCDALFMPGWDIPYSGLNRNQALIYLEPYCKRGDLVPESTTTAGSSGYEKNPYYRTGFVIGPDATYPAMIYNSNEVAIKLFANETAGDWRLWQYSPYAWSGTPPEVMASALMTAGLDADFIDQGAFDDAHDAYDLSTGDSPWSDLDDKWTIYARRLVGTKVSDFIMQCAEHSRDLVFVNEAGEMSISSWTSPTNTVTGLTPAGDQILDVISHTMTMRHTFNRVRASWGEAAKQSWDDDAGTSTTPGIEEIYTTYEPTLESKPNDKWTHDDSDTGSITKFGTIWLKGRKAIKNTRGQPQEVETSVYPFLLSPHVNRATLYEWDPAVDGGGMIHVTNWLTSDAKPRAEIEIRQGPMGFDTGIGDLITNLEITGDGRTIAEARITERTYNFDSMTIDSKILEIPTNT
jgi:hypothetical protein